MDVEVEGAEAEAEAEQEGEGVGVRPFEFYRLFGPSLDAVDGRTCIFHWGRGARHFLARREREREEPTDLID